MVWVRAPKAREINWSRWYKREIRTSPLDLRWFPVKSEGTAWKKSSVVSISLIEVASKEAKLKDEIDFMEDWRILPYTEDVELSLLLGCNYLNEDKEENNLYNNTRNATEGENTESDCSNNEKQWRERKRWHDVHVHYNCQE